MGIFRKKAKRLRKRTASAELVAVCFEKPYQECSRRKINTSLTPSTLISAFLMEKFGKNKIDIPNTRPRWKSEANNSSLIPASLLAFPLLPTLPQLMAEKCNQWPRNCRMNEIRITYSNSTFKLQQHFDSEFKKKLKKKQKFDKKLFWKAFFLYGHGITQTLVKILINHVSAIQVHKKISKK